MRLSTSDRQTIDAFTSGRSRQGSKLSSDGRRLDGHWMGGGNIAEWKGGKIVFHDLGSKAAQTVQSYVRRSAAPNDLASRSATRPRKSGWSVEDKIAEAKAVRGQVAPDMLPLFDHLLSLARSDAKEGAYPYQRRRAGQYIAKAKGFARKHPRVSGDASRRVKRVRTARRDPGGPGKYIVKISNSPRYKGEYSGGATLAEGITEARTFKATVGPRARIEVGYFTFGKSDPEEGRFHLSRTVQQGETSWL